MLSLLLVSLDGDRLPKSVIAVLLLSPFSSFGHLHFQSIGDFPFFGLSFQKARVVLVRTLLVFLFTNSVSSDLKLLLAFVLGCLKLATQLVNQLLTLCLPYSLSCFVFVEVTHQRFVSFDLPVGLV